MTERLTLRTALLLAVAPLMWAGNAVVGRLVHTLIPPLTLNFFRWILAFAILLPLAGWVLRSGSGLWSHWRRFAVLGLLGMGCYNSLQYLALQTSTPLNVTLVASSSPLWMLAIGALVFGARVSRVQMVGAVLSMTGVCVVLARGEWSQLLQLRLVPGDLFVLLATALWAVYSWLLVRRAEPDAIRNDWAAFVLAQVVFGAGLVVDFRRLGVGVDRSPRGLGMAAGGGAGVCGAGPLRAGVSVLEHRYPARRADGGFLFQPHAFVRRHHVCGVHGRNAPALPCDCLRPDRGRHRGVVAQVLRPTCGPGSCCGTGPSAGNPALAFYLQRQADL